MGAVARRIVAAAAALAALAAVSGPASAAPDDRSIGSPKAPVTVIEYASVTCPHCAAWNKEVWPAFRKKYVDTGRVRYVFRELPTPPADLAGAGFLVARCAPPAKYFTVLDALFADQPKLMADHDAKGWLLRAGAKAGLSEAQVTACVSDQAAADAFNARLDANMAEFQVEGTPQFIVGGKKVGQGEVTLAQLDNALRPLLPKPAAHPAKPRRR